MSRSHRDILRRSDHAYEKMWRNKFYNHADGAMSYGDKPWRRIVRYSQSKRKYHAGLKKLERHLIYKNRMHDYNHGHHRQEVQ